MGTFRNTNDSIPEILIVTGALTINYRIASISISNKGDLSGTVNGEELVAGDTFNLTAAEYYEANRFVLDGTGTKLVVTINK